MVAGTLGVDGNDDTLAAEHLCSVADELGAAYRPGIDRYFIRAGFEQCADVGGIIDTTTDRERHKYLFGGTRHDIENYVSVFVRRGDIEKAKLIGALAVIKTGDFDRIAGIA